VRSTSARTRASLAVAALLLLGGLASAQQQTATPYAPRPDVAPPLPSPAPSQLPSLPQAQPLATRYGDPARTPEVTVPAPAASLQPARFRQSLGGGGVYGEEGGMSEYQIQLSPPGLERLGRIDTEAELQERIRQETKQHNPMERVTFPDEPILSRETYYGRGGAWPHRTELVAPSYVCYGRLLFQQLNMERYGWDLGILGPVISAAEFYFDVITLPYHVATAPWRCYETNAGYCLPGDPVPLLIYPPELSVTGTIGEAAALLGVLAIFP
jgi:hypothetical protein